MFFVLVIAVLWTPAVLLAAFVWLSTLGLSDGFKERHPWIKFLPLVVLAVGLLLACWVVWHIRVS